MEPIGEISIDVKLNKKDLANVRRILEGRFEPLPEARLIVKVQLPEKGEKK